MNFMITMINQKIEAVLYDDRSKKIYREVVRRRVIGATGEYNKLKQE